jgi:hypothetical protein
MNFEFWGAFDSLILEKGEVFTIDNGIQIFAPDIAMSLIGNIHIEMFGQVSMSIISSKPLLFISGDLRNLVTNFESSKAYRSLAVFKDFTFDLIEALWFVRDNAVCVRENFFMPEDINSIAIGYYQGVTDAAGSRNPTKFTIKEIDESAKILQKFKEVCPPPNAAEQLFDKMGTREEFLQRGLDSNHLLPYDFPRMTRAFFMLGQARRTTAPAVKITFYMSAFECLFSDGSTEAINYKLGQRVAFFLTSDKLERLKIRDSVKEGYEVRSSYVHGSKLGNKYKNYESLMLISIKIDDLLRQTFLKAIHEFGDQFNLSNDSFKKWIEEELIYGER